MTEAEMRKTLNDATDTINGLGRTVAALKAENLKLREDWNRQAKFWNQDTVSYQAEIRKLRAAAQFAHDHLESMDNYSLVSGARHTLAEALKGKE
jgi:hypothetical protein